MNKMILAVDDENGIGKDGRMPWHHSEDFKYFREYTDGCICIMGRTTFEDIKGFKKSEDGPFLKGRECIVLTHNIRQLHEANNYKNLSFGTGNEGLFSILDFAGRSPDPNMPDICVVGGKQVYNKFIDEKIIQEISVTRVKGTHNCDTFVDLDNWLEHFELSETKKLSENCEIEIYKRIEKA